MKSDYHILKDKQTGNRGIYYYDNFTDFEEEFEEDPKNKEEIPFENWTAEEVCEVLANRMEDCNMHSYLYWPTLVLTALNRVTLEEEKKTQIMHEIMEEMENFHF